MNAEVRIKFRGAWVLLTLLEITKVFSSFTSVAYTFLRSLTAAAVTGFAQPRMNVLRIKKGQSVV